MVKTKAHDYAKNGNTKELNAEIQRNPSVINEIDNVSITFYLLLMLLILLLSSLLSLLLYYQPFFYQYIL